MKCCKEFLTMREFLKQKDLIPVNVNAIKQNYKTNRSGKAPYP